MPRLPIPKRTKRQMKTSLTIEVEDSLLAQVKALTKSQGVTLRQVVEFGLQAYMDAIRAPQKGLK